MTTVWLLAIDFGTTYTAAAVRSDGHTRMVALGADGAFRMPSALWVDQSGAILVGNAAQDQAPLAPDRFERTPKRCLGEGSVLLGQASLDPTVLVSHLLAHVVDEAARLFNNTRPSAVVLTHPAAWAAARRDRLRDAARRAGLDDVQLLAEPVAAAIHLGASVPVGAQVAVFDFGGGTVDVAVLGRTPTGFDIAGPPGGLDPLGGEDTDQHLLDFLDHSPVSQHPDWPNLIKPPDVAWALEKAALRRGIRTAKEALSSQQSYQLFIPGLDQRIRLTRGELTDLIRRDVDSAVDVLLSSIQAAEQSPEALARIFLVGGSSRIPLVAETLWSRLGRRPDTQDDPKSVVAQGAVTWLAQQTTSTPSPPSPQQDRTFLPLAGKTPPRRHRTRIALIAGSVLGLIIFAGVLALLLNRPESSPAPSPAPGVSKRAYVANAYAGTVSMIDTTTNTVVGNPIKVGNNPRNVAVSPDGRHAYVANTNSGTVAVIDTSTNTVIGNRIRVGNSPLGVVVSPDGRHAYIANVGSNTVSVIDTTTNTVTGAPITVGDGPAGVAVSPDGRHAYITNQGSNTVSVIDTRTNTVTGAPITVGDAPAGVVVGPDGHHAYVVNRKSGTVSVIDTTTTRVVGTPITVGDAPAGVVVSPDGRRAYVTNNDSGTVSVIDTTINIVIGTIPVGDAPAGVTVTPDGRHAYITNHDSGTVSVIDTRTNAVTGAPITVGEHPGDLKVSPDGRRVYVANAKSDSVSVIDTATNTVTGATSVGDSPTGVTVTPDGHRVYVTDFDSDTVSVIDTSSNTVIGNPIPVGDAPAGVAVSPDGRHAYVANAKSDTVVVIDTTTNTVVGNPLTVGDAPLGVVVSPDGRRAYVTNTASDTVSVIDTTTNTVVGTVPVGDYPGGLALTPDR